MPRAADPHLRERLIAAATAEFAAAGYAGTRLDAIAERAGVTKGGIYFHFDGKEDLFFAVLDHWRDRRRRLLQVPATGVGGAASALRTFLSGYLAFHFREPEATHLLRVLATELRGRFTARLREDDRQEQRWLRASVRDLLAEGVRDGSLFTDDPAGAAFVIASAVYGVLEQWQTAPDDVEPHCHQEELARVLVGRYATGASGDDAAVAHRSEYDFRDRTP
ncbi:MAG: TetR/AcrR family transcriptional regulator [Planctomycetes bacterium]|nr:TetR/AcrR family transcriptional regulator [Planctomycetota bacterium]